MKDTTKNVIPIHQAKTNLSKLIKRATAGETIYIGAYGQAQAQLVAPAQKTTLRLGAWRDKQGAPTLEQLEKFDELDQEMVDLFENSKIFPDGDV